MEKLYHDLDPTKLKQNVLIRDDKRNFIVNEEQLWKLLRHCQNCGSYCSNPVIVGHGVDAEFHVDCVNCKDVVSWSTQPDLESSKLKKGNLDVTASVLLSGRTYEDFSSVAANLDLKILAESTFYE